MKSLLTIVIVLFTISSFSQNHEIFLENTFTENNSYFSSNGFTVSSIDEVEEGISITYSSGTSKEFCEIIISYLSNDEVKSIIIATNSFDLFNAYHIFCKKNMIEVDSGSFDKGYTSPDYGISLMIKEIYGIIIVDY